MRCHFSLEHKIFCRYCYEKIKNSLLCLTVMFAFAACSDQNSNSSNSSSMVNNSNSTDSTQQSGDVSSDTQSSTEGKHETPDSPASTDGNRILVACFAYAENIGDTCGIAVDAIASAGIGRTSNANGNLQVMAQIPTPNILITASCSGSCSESVVICL